MTSPMLTPMRSAIRRSAAQLAVRRGHGCLQPNCALDGVDDAAELEQYAVADQLEDATTIVADERLEDLGAP